MEPEMGNTNETPGLNEVSTKLTRIAELARQMSGKALTTLAHHIDIKFLREAYERVRKDRAPGIDGVTAKEYEAKLEENLKGLLERFKSGTYKAPPVKRAYIAKPDGGVRGLGLPTFEDKVLQKAVAMVLGAIYEQDFLPCSYGYRPDIGALHALRDLREELMRMGGGWVLEVDIKSFFDTIEHAILRSFLDQRVRDGVIRRTIDKWLKAGVLEEGTVRHPDEGTPQGGVISPLLANIYLHEVLDVWFENDVRPRMRGHVRLIRYADDFVICFEREDDAKRVAEVLPKRFAKYGLTLHPDKTRLLHYEPPAPGSDGDEPPKFDFLGFTHYWARSKSGRWVIKRKTIHKRLVRKIKEIWEWCKRHRHLPVNEQQSRLNSRLIGYYHYFGIRCNYEALAALARETRKAWQYWLNRRSQHSRMPWERLLDLLTTYPLAVPRIIHRWV